MSEWNITMQIILEKRMLQNINMKIVNILSKIAADCKFWLQKFQFLLIMQTFWFIVYFYSA